MDKIISKESLIKKLVCFKALFLLAALLFVSADFTRAAFMDYGIGTRGGGKSGAFITTADDSSAGEWNVAALLNVSGFDAMFEYYSPFTNLPNVSINHSYGAGAYGINDNMSAGASYMAFDGDSIYKSESYRVSFAAGNYDFIDFPFAAGVSLKYLSHSFFFDKGEQQDIEDPDINGSESAGDFTLDAGILLEPVFDMPVGISVKNILPADVGIYNEDIVPLEASMGVGYRILPSGGFFKEILPEAFASYRDQEWGTEDDKINMGAGVELWSSERVLGLRAGVNRYEASLGGSYTLELGVSGIRIDYAAMLPFVDFSDHWGHHRISFSYMMGRR